MRYFGEGTRIVMAAYNLGCAEGSDDLRTVAIDYADFLLKRFAQPEGHFVEYEKCPWLTPETLWHTIHWGAAFHGNDMEKARELIHRDMDDEGWIQGENGGGTGHYQLLGSDLIALLAWESGDSSLAETTHRLMSLHKQFSTPTMFWNGNFGIRSNKLNKIGRRRHISS